MAIYKQNPNPNAFVRYMRKVYNPIGFQKGYNFTLFFILAGALFGFALARSSYMNNGNFLSHAGPGEAFYYRQSWYNIGVRIHLLSCIPAGILVTFQFVPIIRHKLILVHRINGYIVTTLLIFTNVGALMICRRAFGGTIATQSAVGLIAIFTTGGSIMAYINIKRLQIEQHRAWMLRTWVVAGGIVTTRIIMIIATQIISAIGSYYIAMSCQQISQSNGDASKYLACRADPNGWTVVHAAFATANGIEEVAATFQLTFGMSLWLTFALHIFGVEVYLQLTKAETERLRRVSYERQMERGWLNPGSAGLTSDRLGDEEQWILKNSPVQSAPVGSTPMRKRDPVDVQSVSSSELGRPSSTPGL
jgi:uncharacterized membrane protein